jgi:hypothetical protein
MSLFHRIRKALATSAAEYWPVLALVLLVLCAYNIVERRRLLLVGERSSEQFAAARNALVEQDTALTNLTGKAIEWVSLRPSPTVNASGYRIVAVVNALECGNPLGQLTEFLRRVQFTPRDDWRAEDRTVAIVQAPAVQTAQSYRASNNFRFPVLHDPEGRFAKRNHLPNGPMILVIDPADRIVFAASPASNVAPLWKGHADAAMALIGS